MSKELRNKLLKEPVTEDEHNDFMELFGDKFGHPTEIPSEFERLIAFSRYRLRDISYSIKEALCPCGHIHKPSSNGIGLRTYCVEGSQCNSDKCKEFVKHAKSEGGSK